MGQLLLVVDDSRTVCRAVQLVLHASMYDVVAVGTASEAIRVARAQRPAAIIVDYHLPDASGFDLVRQIRADNALYETPVLMLTGAFHAWREEQVAECGANGAIRKPFRTDDLIAALAQATAGPAMRSAQFTPAVPEPAVPERLGLTGLGPDADELDDRFSDDQRAVPLPPEPTPEAAVEHGAAHQFLGYGNAPATRDELDVPTGPPVAAAPEPPQTPAAATSPPFRPSTQASAAIPSDAGGAAALRRVRPGPPPPPNVPRRPLAPAPPPELDETLDTGPQPAHARPDEPITAEVQRVARAPLAPPAPETATAPQPAVAPSFVPVPAPAAAAPAEPTAPTAPVAQPSGAHAAVRTTGEHAAAGSIDPAQLRVLVRESVAPMVRDMLPALVKEFLASMLRQTGQKLDEYSRQRIDAFVARELVALSEKAVADALADVPTQVQEAIDRQLAALGDS